MGTAARTVPTINSMPAIGSFFFCQEMCLAIRPLRKISATPPDVVVSGEVQMWLYPERPRCRRIWILETSRCIRLSRNFGFLVLMQLRPLLGVLYSHPANTERDGSAE